MSQRFSKNSSSVYSVSDKKSVINYLTGFPVTLTEKDSFGKMVVFDSKFKKFLAKDKEDIRKQVLLKNFHKKNGIKTDAVLKICNTLEKEMLIENLKQAFDMLDRYKCAYEKVCEKWKKSECEKSKILREIKNF